MIPEKVVSLLEILRAYAEAYPAASHSLTLISTFIAQHQDGNTDVRDDKLLLQRLHGHLMALHTHCEHLPMTSKSVKSLADLLQSDVLATWSHPAMGILQSIADIQSRLTDELSLNLFFKLPATKKPYFDNPLHGWREVVTRFSETTTDIEEMSKCFALSRYPASVFHSVRVIESGLIHLGSLLEVTDPKSGWTAVTAKLETLVIKTKYADLPEQFIGFYPFLEQIHAVAQSLKSAWRNKISHAQGSATLLTSDFTPDIAEEIMVASRSFMRRLATEMPSEAQ